MDYIFDTLSNLLQQTAFFNLTGTPITGETIVQSNSAGAASKTILLTLSAGDELSLYNTSATEATLSSASLTVLKLA